MDFRRLLLISLFGIFGVDALSCNPCNETVCHTATNCSGSMTHGPCGCCPECARQTGENCGGPWDVEGKCDVGLACVANPIKPPSIDSFPGEVFYPVDPFFDQREGTCQVYYEDCSDVCDYLNDRNNIPVGFSVLGRSDILKNRRTRRGYSVYCDCTENTAEAWMVIQRRSGDLESFDRTWMEYLAGFGSSDSDYWLGLEILNQLTEARNHELEIRIKYKDGNETNSRYGSVRIGGEETQYRLTIESLIKLTEDPFQVMHNEMKFSTKDVDNDEWTTGECAKWYKGGWWFNKCTDYNLNGIYYPTYSPLSGPDRIRWNSDNLVEMVEMRIRPTEPLESIASSGYGS